MLCLRLTAQLPEDALRASWTTPGGTAREQAIGGAMGSLGGEISSNFVNPAGLGFYRTREIVLSPGWQLMRNKANYLNTNNSSVTASHFNLGVSGLVTGHTGYNGNNSVFSIAVNQTASFNQHISYTGINNYSSGAEQYAEEFAYGNQPDIDKAISTPGLYSYGTRMALYTYLVDTATINGQLQVVAQPQKAGSVKQQNDLHNSGGITEIALNLATGIADKWFIGGGIGVPILSYTREQTYREVDASGNTNNDFESYTYTERYTSRGFGLNAKLGVIFKPVNSVRVGLAVHTPSVIAVKDKISGSMSTSLEAYSVPQQVTTGELDAAYGPANTVNYNLYTPWRFIASGSYLLGGGEEDVKNQRGFITADVEYVTTKSSHFKPENEDGTDGPDDYYDAVNSTIKSIYKNYLGVRLGSEMKWDTYFSRVGFAYYTNPYKDSKELKANKMYFTAGGGWRDAGMFVDLAFVACVSKDVNFPYLLSDKNNVVSSLKQLTGTMLMTVGFKF